MAAEEGDLGLLCRSVVSFLEGTEGVRSVQLADRPGVAYAALLGWERRHHPFALPEDLRAFLCTSDGLSLTWAMEHMSEEVPLGCMHINQLSRIREVVIDPREVRMSSRHAAGGGSDRAGVATEEAADDDSAAAGVRAFDLDDEVSDGRLCLLFFDNRRDDPEVWFQDLSRMWHFVAPTFSDYFRLMVMHVGLARWHYAYTEVGLDPVTKQWMRLLAAERFQVDDEHWARARRVAKCDSLPQAAAAGGGSRAARGLTSGIDNKAGNDPQSLTAGSFQSATRAARRPRRNHFADGDAEVGAASQASGPPLRNSSMGML